MVSLAPFSELRAAEAVLLLWGKQEKGQSGEEGGSEGPWQGAEHRVPIPQAEGEGPRSREAAAAQGEKEQECFQLRREPCNEQPSGRGSKGQEECWGLQNTAMKFCSSEQPLKSETAASMQ